MGSLPRTRFGPVPQGFGQPNPKLRRVSGRGLHRLARFAPKGKGLELLQYGETFRYPAEVYSLAWPGGGTRSVYRDAKFAITDIWLAADGTAYLAGVKVRGQLRSLIPEPVQVLTRKDLANWTPLPVEYRAEAIGAILAGAGGDHLSTATGTGMILKLVR